MNTNSKRLSIYTVLMLICTAVAVTLRTIACLNSLDGGTGYFENGSLVTVSDPIIWGVVILSFSYIFLASKSELHPSFSTAATYVPTGILGAATLFLGARILTRTIGTSRYPILSVEALTTPSTILSLIAFLLSIVSIGYFFFNVYTTESKTEVRAAFAVGIIAFFAIYAMLIYFDTSLPLNNSGKIINQMAYLFAAMFFLYEARISLGREMWRTYSAFALATAALTAYSSIPALITYYAKGYIIFGTQRGAFTSIEEYMLTLALFVYAISKLICTISLKEDSRNVYADAITAFAEDRENEVNDSFHRFQEDFASKQLSIFELYGGGDVEATEEEIEEAPEEIIEEEEKVVMISDDAIYESIFGKMPEKEVEEALAEEEEPETVEEQDTEMLVDSLLSALENSKATTNVNKDENQDEENTRN